MSAPQLFPGRTLCRGVDALPIPDDLIQLQEQLNAANAELAAYSRTKIAEYRGRYPAPHQAVERIRWSAEEITELDRLSAAARQLYLVIHRHPLREPHWPECVVWPSIPVDIRT